MVKPGKAETAIEVPEGTLVYSGPRVLQSMNPSAGRAAGLLTRIMSALAAETPRVRQVKTNKIAVLLSM
jgi:hypothetical protein